MGPLLATLDLHSHQAWSERVHAERRLDHGGSAFGFDRSLIPSLSGDTRSQIKLHPRGR